MRWTSSQLARLAMSEPVAVTQYKFISSQIMTATTKLESVKQRLLAARLALLNRICSYLKDRYDNEESGNRDRIPDCEWEELHDYLEIPIQTIHYRSAHDWLQQNKVEIAERLYQSPPPIMVCLGVRVPGIAIDMTTMFAELNELVKQMAELTTNRDIHERVLDRVKVLPALKYDWSQLQMVLIVLITVWNPSVGVLIAVIWATKTGHLTWQPKPMVAPVVAPIVIPGRRILMEVEDTENCHDRHAEIKENLARADRIRREATFESIRRA